MRARPLPLPFADAELSPNQFLTRYHYLGPITRGDVYRDARGVMVFANPSSRRLPQQRWLELVRWCIVCGLGSEQWKDARAWVLATFSRRDHGRELFGSERGPYRRAVSRLRLAVGADLASTA